MTSEQTTRRCITCGQVLEKEHLLRFTLGPDNLVIPDFKRRLPGRGVWVHCARSCLNKAIAGNLFAKSLKCKVKPAPELEQMVERLLRVSGLQAVSLARKAGALVTGMEKVSEALKKHNVAFVLEAIDAGADGTEKVARLSKGLQIYKLFTSEELDSALDKANTIHAAFLKSEIADMVRREFNRLADFLNL